MDILHYPTILPAIDTVTNQEETGVVYTLVNSYSDPFYTNLVRCQLTLPYNTNGDFITKTLYYVVQPTYNYTLKSQQHQLLEVIRFLGYLDNDAYPPPETLRAIGVIVPTLWSDIVNEVGRGDLTKCPGDCTGDGECKYIVNEWKCVCNESWAGIACNIERFIFDNLTHILNKKLKQYFEEATSLSVLNTVFKDIGDETLLSDFMLDILANSTARLIDTANSGSEVGGGLVVLRRGLIRMLSFESGRLAELRDQLKAKIETFLTLQRKLIYYQNTEELEELEDLGLFIKTASFAKDGNNHTVTAPSGRGVESSIPSSLFSDSNFDYVETPQMLLTTSNINFYQWGESSLNNSKIITDVVLVEFIDPADASKIPIKRLKDPIKIKYPIPPDSNVKKYIQYYWDNRSKFNGRSLVDVMKKVVKCLYWEDDVWSDKGLELVEVTDDYFVCSATHTTEFVVSFLDEGLDTLLSGNYDLIFDMDAIRLLLNTPLTEIVGFYFDSTFLIIYFLIMLIALCIDMSTYSGISRHLLLLEILDSKTKRKLIQRHRSRSDNLKDSSMETENLNQLEAKEKEISSSIQSIHHEQTLYSELPGKRMRVNLRQNVFNPNEKIESINAKLEDIEDFAYRTPHAVKIQETRIQKRRATVLNIEKAKALVTNRTLIPREKQKVKEEEKLESDALFFERTLPPTLLKSVLEEKASLKGIIWEDLKVIRH